MEYFKLLTPKLSEFLINNLRSQVDLVITITCSIIPISIKYFQQSASNFLSRKKGQHFKIIIRKRFTTLARKNVPFIFYMNKIEF